LRSNQSSDERSLPRGAARNTNKRGRGKRLRQEKERRKGPSFINIRDAHFVRKTSLEGLSREGSNSGTMGGRRGKQINVLWPNGLKCFSEIVVEGKARTQDLLNVRRYRRLTQGRIRPGQHAASGSAHCDRRGVAKTKNVTHSESEKTTTTSGVKENL